MGSAPKISYILYATDLGEHTRPVFRQAINQARAHQAKIIMIHVVEPLSETARAVISAYMPDSSLEKMQEDGMKNTLAKMKERIKKFRNDECQGIDAENVPVKEMIVVAGRPSEQILTAAEAGEVGMIIVGQSSKKVLGSRVMGSTARRVARLAKVPVLIVPNT